MEQVVINFNPEDIENGNYTEMIINSVKSHLFGDRNIQYIFPQIKKGGSQLKNKIADGLKELDIKKEYNVGFLSTKTEEAVFKILFL